MEADFSGWATKAGMKCSDGRIILPDAFKHQDTTQVPLVWQHGHNDPENVLGHTILENRGSEGVYAYGFFNKSSKAVHMREAVDHKDVRFMSIWANELIERGGRVIHGVIREVSLVLSGANPGALIENVTIRHSDGDTLTLEDEVIIHTGLALELTPSAGMVVQSTQVPVQQPQPVVANSANLTQHELKEVREVTDVVHAAGGDLTVQDVYDSMNDQQKQVLHFMIGQALQDAQDQMQQDNMGNYGRDEMGRNVFEQRDEGTSQHVLSHSDIRSIVADATKSGSLKDAVTNYALAHNIDDIDILFPEARTIGATPEFLARRTEWVTKVLGAAKKSPFARVRTFAADLTMDEARAKGYIKGNMKKEEFFSVSRRTTTPTTVYKKQKLDRDDIIDITDFDVVAWLKGEMRLMLDEELARAVLLSDGRDVASDDKVNEQNIRPIANDHDLFVTTVSVNIDDVNSTVQEIIDAIISNRQYFKGTGLPTMFTTEYYLSRFLLLKDTVGRRIYKSIDEIATELRVSEIIPVEAMETESDLVAVLVNMQDYVIGADNGGAVSMFDDFDIDYNNYKYLIETRMSGALTKLKSAIVVRKVDSASAPVTPTPPTFDGSDITIVATTGAVYKNAADDSPVTGTVSVPAGTAIQIYAVPDTGKYFPSSANTSWTFRNRDTA